MRSSVGITASERVCCDVELSSGVRVCAGHGVGFDTDQQWNSSDG